MGHSHCQSITIRIADNPQKTLELLRSGDNSEDQADVLHKSGEVPQ